MATTPSSSADTGARSRSSSTPDVRAASSALGEIGSQPPKTRSSRPARRDEIADQGIAILAPLAQPNVRDLRERPDRHRVPAARRQHTGDEGRGHGAETRGENPELSGRGRNRCRLSHAASLGREC